MQRDLARGKKIAADVLAEVAGTPLDKGVVLDELAQKRKATRGWPFIGLYGEFWIVIPR